ncbi:MAG: hypothetical protein JRH01_09585 [Deltaproteobacteria bacterium]|nr:hypothetical protein [Deltaproteobacteria bacterium]
MNGGQESRAKEEARWASGMRRAQEGDAAAYRALLTELDGVLRAYLTRVIGEASLAEDGVQETLIAAVPSLADGDRPPQSHRHAAPGPEPPGRHGIPRR